MNANVSSPPLDIGMIHAFQEYGQDNGQWDIGADAHEIRRRMIVHHSEQHHADACGYIGVLQVVHSSSLGSYWTMNMPMTKMARVP